VLCGQGAESQRLWRRGFAMTESNPVSLDMVLFDSSPSPDKKRTSSGSARPRGANDTADASDEEDAINPEPMALHKAFETPPRSRRAVVQDFTPEGKIRPRESEEEGTRRSSEIRRALAPLAASPASTVPGELPVTASSDPYLTESMCQSAPSASLDIVNIPVEQFGDQAMYKLADLPPEAGHMLALMALVEKEPRASLWNPVLTPVLRVAGYQSLYDQSHMEQNKEKVRKWIERQDIPERSQCEGGNSQH